MKYLNCPPPWGWFQILEDICGLQNSTTGLANNKKREDVELQVMHQYNGLNKYKAFWWVNLVDSSASLYILLDPLASLFSSAISKV